MAVSNMTICFKIMNNPHRKEKGYLKKYQKLFY